MIQIYTFFVLLFTFQFIWTLNGAPAGWLFIVWSSLMIFLWLNRRKLYLPQDHPHASYRKRTVYTAFLFLLFLACSQFYLQSYLDNIENLKNQSILTYSSHTEHDEIVGYLHSLPTFDGNRIMFDIKVVQVNGYPAKYKEKIRLTRYADSYIEIEQAQALRRGDLFWGNVQLRQPEAPRNPGAFNYQRYLEYDKIYAIGTVQQEWSFISRTSWINLPFRWVDHVRDTWRAQVERIFQPDVSPLVLAMTVGDRSQLNPDLVEVYQELGIIHILAISGLHVGIVVWGLYRGLLLLPITREAAIHTLLFFIPVYIFMSGAQPSVVRAGLMAMLALILLRFGWWKHSLFALYAVYIGTLLWSPFLLFHIGYQLSFLITFVLITGYPAFDKWTKSWEIPLFFKQWLGISLLAQVGSLPIILYHFYQFSPFSLLVNLFVVPIYSVILIPASFALTLLSFISVHPVQLFVLFYEKIYDWVTKGMDIVYQFPFAILHTGQPSWWWTALYIFLTVVFFAGMEQGKRLGTWFMLGAYPLLIFIQLVLPYFDSRAHMMILDVGQGDAIVIELPYRQEVMMIDLGGQIQFPKEEWQERDREFEVGRDVVLPYLRYRGIQKIDRVIITHGHYDHFGGIQGLLGKIRIKGLYRPSVEPQSSFEREWMANTISMDIPVYSLTSGDGWTLPYSTCVVLSPDTRNEWITDPQNLHDYNVVLLQSVYDFTFLWSGDVEQKGEREIMMKHPDLAADVLKVAHHGSKTSTSAPFLETVQPKASIISVGRNNRYHHPHPDVINRLAEQGAPVYRTDLHGGIHILVSPKGMKVSPTLQSIIE